MKNISKEALDRLILVRESLDQTKNLYIPGWREISTHLYQDANEWDNVDPGATGPGDRSAIFDNTGMKASSLLSDGIQGYGFNRASAWFRYAYEDQQYQRRASSMQSLQNAERHNYKQLAKSNFYDEGRLMVRSAADFGTGMMVRKEDLIRGIPVYKTLHLARYNIDESDVGEVDVLFYDAWMTLEEARRLFKTVPKTMEDAGKDKPTKKFKVTQFIAPVGRYDLDIDSKGKPYVSVYYTRESGDEVLMTGGYSRKPFFGWRWNRALNGGVWGAEAPGLIELCNMKQANATRMDISRMRQLAARPPLKATPGLRGKIQMTPNGVTHLEPGEDFTPAIGITGQIQGVAEDLADLRKSVNESYHTDFFLILTQNIDRTKTATEVSGLEGEKAALLTSFYGRMKAEYLEPALEDLFMLEVESGRFQVPDDMRGKDIKTDMVSQLEQTQKRYLELTNTDQALMKIFSLVQIKPDVLDTVDLDAYIASVAEAYNMDKRVLKDLSEVKRIRDNRAKMQAAMQQQAMAMQQAQVGADVANKTSKAPEPGSPAAQAMQQPDRR